MKRSLRRNSDRASFLPYSNHQPTQEELRYQLINKQLAENMMELIDRLPLGWKPVTWEFSIIPSEDDRYFKTPREVYNEQYQLREAKQRKRRNV